VSRHLVRLSEGVEIEPERDGRCVVADTFRQKYFSIGPREAAFLSSLDGTVAADRLRHENPTGFRPEQVDALLAWFAEKNLLEGHKNAAATPADVPERRNGWLRGLISIHDQGRFTLWQPDALLTRHASTVRALLSRPTLALYLLATLSPAVLFVAKPAYAIRAASHYVPRMDAAVLVGLWLAVLATIAVHELAHALACKRFGGRVGRIGLKLMFLQPIVFCDVSDSWRFVRERRIAVALAGVLAQLVITGIVLTVWQLTAAPVLLQYAIVNVTLAVLNMFPFVKLDGYWVIAHALREPNLLAKATGEVDRRFRSLVSRAGRPAPSASPMIFWYGVAHLTFVPVFWIMGVMGAYRLGAKLSLVLGIAAAALISTIVAARMIHRVVRYARNFNEWTPA